MMLKGEEIYLHVGDLKKLFFSLRGKLLRLFLVASCSAFGYFLLREPVYTARASFKYAASRSDPTVSLRGFLQGNLLQSADESVICVMRSSSVLSRMIEKKGLQVRVQQRGALATACLKIWDNFLAEIGVSLSDRPRFIWKDVEFLGEKPLGLSLRVLDGHSYELFDVKNVSLGVAHVGQRVHGKGFSLCLSAIPPGISYKRLYPLTVLPMQGCIKEVQKRLQVRADKLDKKLLYLIYTDCDRHRAAGVLNQLMQSYQDFLKQEHEEITSEQLAYLEKREKELLEKLEKELSSHVAYLSKSLSENGYLSLTEEVEKWNGPKREYLNRLTEMDLGMRRLTRHPFAHLRAETPRKMDRALFKLSLQEERLRALPFAPAPSDQEFSSLTLEMAEKLQMEYCQQLDALRASLKEVLFLEAQIQQPSFELSSLSTVLSDSVTQQLVGEASALSLSLQDEDNRSEKEQLRLKEALANQKGFLHHHLNQTAELLKLRIGSLEERLSSLQKATLDLMGQEKRLLEDKLREIAGHMAGLPEKWLYENQMALKRDLSMSLLQGLAELTESKNVSQNLYRADSRPLDKARAPTRVDPPRLLLLSCTVSLLLLVAYFLFHLFRGLIRGLPASFEALQSTGLCLLGSIEEELNSARRASSLLSTGGRLSSFLGRTPLEFTCRVADLLGAQGKKVLVIDCDFASTHTSGLWEYLREERAAPAQEHRGLYDFLPAGTATFYSQESLRHPRFLSLLENLKAQYDHLLFSARLPLQATAVASFQTFSNTVVATVKDESVGQLLTFRDQCVEQGVVKVALIYEDT